MRTQEDFPSHGNPEPWLEGSCGAWPGGPSWPERGGILDPEPAAQVPPGGQVLPRRLGQGPLGSLTVGPLLCASSTPPHVSKDAKPAHTRATRSPALAVSLLHSQDKAVKFLLVKDTDETCLLIQVPSGRLEMNDSQNPPPPPFPSRQTPLAERHREGQGFPGRLRLGASGSRLPRGLGVGLHTDAPPASQARSAEGRWAACVQCCSSPLLVIAFTSSLVPARPSSVCDYVCTDPLAVGQVNRAHLPSRRGL